MRFYFDRKAHELAKIVLETKGEAASASGHIGRKLQVDGRTFTVDKDMAVYVDGRIDAFRRASAARRGANITRQTAPSPDRNTGDDHGRHRCPTTGR